MLISKKTVAVQKKLYNGLINMFNQYALLFICSVAENCLNAEPAVSNILP